MENKVLKPEVQEQIEVLENQVKNFEARKEEVEKSEKSRMKDMKKVLEAVDKFVGKYSKGYSLKGFNEELKIKLDRLSKPVAKPHELEREINKTKSKISQLKQQLYRPMTQEERLQQLEMQLKGASVSEYREQLAKKMEGDK